MYKFIFKINELQFWKNKYMIILELTIFVLAIAVTIVILFFVLAAVENRHSNNGSQYSKLDFSCQATYEKTDKITQEKHKGE